MRFTEFSHHKPFAWTVFSYQPFHDNFGGCFTAAIDTPRIVLLCGSRVPTMALSGSLLTLLYPGGMIGNLEKYLHMRVNLEIVPGGCIDWRLGFHSHKTCRFTIAWFLFLLFSLGRYPSKMVVVPVDHTVTCQPRT